MSTKNQDMNRRRFLKNMAYSSIAIGGLPHIVKARTLGRQGAVSPSNKINMSCIGIGGMGTINMKAFLDKDDVQMVAVCDLDKVHARRAQSTVNYRYKNKDCAVYFDFRELLQRNDLDAVMIAVPDHWHALIAVAAARAGLDIYGEKPLAYNIPEGRALCDAVQEHGVVWQTGSWQRSERHFRFACELVRNGRIGEVHTVYVGLPEGHAFEEKQKRTSGPVPEELDYDMWVGPAAWTPYHEECCHFNFRWNTNFAAGAISDWGAHHLDIANWGMGTEYSSPLDVTGSAIYPDGDDGLYDNPLQYKFECTYAEGFKMIGANAGQVPKGMGAHFIGTEGWVHVNRGGVAAEPASLLNSVIGPGEINLYESNDHYANFLECVRSRKLTITPAEVAHHAILPGYLGNIAMQLGRKLRWDGKKEQFIDDDTANRMLTRPLRSPWRF
ncbi:MAG: Gfo/Idh/MocA family oxidoreductase [Deferribacteres bacterium]|nr:Gfo/Idh/MocA family oxidoreductase [candidate division KSB1 bacterium]MCB9502014.1 Gfo/Idh/MocA family oxidoreductase [Deferribacteres bacterium]